MTGFTSGPLDLLGIKLPIIQAPMAGLSSPEMALNAAKARGEFGFGAQWAGQGASLARSLSTSALVLALAGKFGEAWT